MASAAHDERHAPIRRVLLADGAYDRLLADIVTGHYLPHERIRVDAIAHELGISRTPVREALMRLQLNRFVDVMHNSSTQVAEWSATDMRDRLEVMGRLLTTIVADPRIEFEALVADGEAALRSGESDTAAFLTVAEAIVRHASNRIAAYTVDGLIMPLRLFLTNDVLNRHGVALRPGAASRCNLLVGALGAARLGSRDLAAESLGAYIGLIATLVDPRASDVTPSSEASTEAPVTDLRATA